ncbi:cell division ATP-binding protein FtsE [Salmonella enterica subsp. enterica]|uniref:Cell division ATP-binding protein FtsE n=1 Tax=Salmonella enterica I TaxID=59201 RepID=A0A379WJK2_SALET|nr:cell division ATP-binding protein FtsE [Salmonella enterica subsp. enterica]
MPFLRRQIGMIFQDHHLLMDRTVYDNVAIPLIIAGASGDDIRRRVSRRWIRLDYWTKRETSRFNSPEANNSAWASPARWSISQRYCWRMNRPGTWTTRCRRILRLFEEFNRVGVTVLMATHDIGLISRRSYRQLVLSDGHLHGGLANE